MSVRMALAKLCACTVGGAIIGGGAVQMAANPPARPALVQTAKARTMDAKRVSVKRVKRVKEQPQLASAECLVTPGKTVTTTRTITYPAPPAPALAYAPPRCRPVAWSAAAAACRS
jgi:hypothetical protein